MSDASAGYTRQRLQLVAAGALVAVALVATNLGLWLLSSRGLSLLVTAAAAVALVAAGALSGQLAQVRREAGQVLAAAAGLAALAAALLLFLATLVLVLGRLPVRAETAILPAALVGAAVAALAFAPLRSGSWRPPGVPASAPVVRRSRCSMRSATGPPATCRPRSCCGSWPRRCGTRTTSPESRCGAATAPASSACSPCRTGPHR